MILFMLSVFLLNAVILLTFIIWIPRLLYSLELSTKSNKIRPSVDNNSRYYLTIKYVVQLWLNNQEGNAYIIGLCLNLLVTPILESQFNFTATVLVASASKYPFYISRQCWCDFFYCRPLIRTTSPCNTWFQCYDHFIFSHRWWIRIRLSRNIS